MLSGDRFVIVGNAGVEFDLSCKSQEALFISSLDEVVSVVE